MDNSKKHEAGDWSFLGGLLNKTLLHRVDYRPREMIRDYKAGTLLPKTIEAARQAQVLVFNQLKAELESGKNLHKDWNALMITAQMMQEVIQGIIFPVEERNYSSKDVDEAGEVYDKIKDSPELDAALEKAGVAWAWNPSWEWEQMEPLQDLPITEQPEWIPVVNKWRERHGHTTIASPTTT